MSKICIANERHLANCECIATYEQLSDLVTVTRFMNIDVFQDCLHCFTPTYVYSILAANPISILPMSNAATTFCRNGCPST